MLRENEQSELPHKLHASQEPIDYRQILLFKENSWKLAVFSVYPQLIIQFFCNLCLKKNISYI